MDKHSFLGAKTAKFGLGVLVVAALAACGGGSSDTLATVASSNVTVGTDNSTTTAKTATATVLAAAASTTAPVTFSSGFAGTDASGAAVAVTESTKVSFTSNATDATKPGFAVSSASGSAEGTTTLGSCSFTVTKSSYPTSHPFALGKTVKVDPCTVQLDTAGKTAGVSGTAAATWTFGTSKTTVNVPAVSVSSSGSVSIGSVTIPNLTVTIKTTGSGS